MTQLLERLFHLNQANSNPRRELIAGVTTFLTMAYVIFVVPKVLSDAGMDYGAVFTATCLASALGCFLMGFIANYPIAIAPGMGLNAYFAYVVVLGDGYSWQVALGVVFLSGLLFVILTLLKVRQWVIAAIPDSLKRSLVSGIGLLLGIIALKNVGIVEDDPHTLIGPGSFQLHSVWLFLFGFSLIVAMEWRKVPGAILIGMFAVTVLGLLFHYVPYEAIVSLPPSIKPTFMALDIKDLMHLSMLMLIFSFFFVAFFDNVVTLMAVAYEADIIKDDKEVPRLKRALLADSMSVMAGSVLGVSPMGSYIESVTGVRAGGRTGLTAIVVGIGFLLCLFLSPLAHSIPGYATSAALLFVSCVMPRSLTKIDWDDITEAVPAGLAALVLPFTFSIAFSVSLGFVSYVLIKVLSGRWRELNPMVVIMALLFGGYLLTVQ